MLQSLHNGSIAWLFTTFANNACQCFQFLSLLCNFFVYQCFAHASLTHKFVDLEEQPARLQFIIFALLCWTFHVQLTYLIKNFQFRNTEGEMLVSVCRVSAPLSHLCTCIIDYMSEWKLPPRGRNAYRHCWQPKLPNFLYSSNTTSWRANNNNYMSETFPQTNLPVSQSHFIKLTGLTQCWPKSNQSWLMITLQDVRHTSYHLSNWLTKQCTFRFSLLSAQYDITSQTKKISWRNLHKDCSAAPSVKDHQNFVLSTCE